MRTRFYVIFGLLVGLSCPSVAQNISDRVNTEEFRLRVKQIEEFMQRFNREAIPQQVDANDPNIAQKAIAALFEREFAESHRAEAVGFVQSMVRDSVRLDFTYDNWRAVARCAAKINKRPTTITLTLKTEYIGDGMYKWAIVSATGDDLALFPKKKSKYYVISPVDNEINFIQLNSITKHEPENILNYCDKDFEIDQTSVFYALVASNQLRIEYVEELTYQFFTDSHDFFVKYFPRETLNSGWLIYELKNKEQQKKH